MSLTIYAKHTDETLSMSYTSFNDLRHKIANTCTDSSESISKINQGTISFITASDTDGELDTDACAGLMETLDTMPITSHYLLADLRNIVAIGIDTGHGLYWC